MGEEALQGWLRYRGEPERGEKAKAEAAARQKAWEQVRGPLQPPTAP
jgi:hypothetical protein